MKTGSKTEKMIILFMILFMQFSNNSINGQNWSFEYVLFGDSSVYTLSRDNILRGKSVEFFFPAYKYYQTATKKAIQSEKVGNDEIIELKFNTKKIICDRINFESDLYAEGVDSIQIFLKTTDDHLIPVTFFAQQNSLFGYKEYTYLPTIYFSVKITKDNIKSIQITGKSNNQNRKLILGRLTGSQRVEYTTNNMMAVDSLVSKYPFDKKSDTFYKLPIFYLRLHSLYFCYRLVLKNCWTSSDSIQCISQFTNKILNEYRLYDVYGINKQELIYCNDSITKTAKNIESYYDGMKEIIASLNCCHIRLSTSKQDNVESPLQSLYFYNISNKITVSAIFDPSLKNKIRLGDRLLSINHVPLERLYQDFSKKVYASSPQQRDIKITQKLLYISKAVFGDSLLLEFQNNTNNYSVRLNKSNFSGKKVIPSDFKIISDNTIEKYNNIIYLKPVFQESTLIPYLYSHKKELNQCDGIIIDFRGCSAADYSYCTFFSFLISKNTLLYNNDSKFLNSHSNFNYVIKPSVQINIKSPVVFLVDSRTTCSPELMINALRKVRSNIYVIGATNTAGSAQLSMEVKLPNNVSLVYFEGVTKDAFGQIIDNNIGIVPDTIVNFDTYKDLFPYNDRLKSIGLKYLGYSKENKK